MSDRAVFRLQDIKVSISHIRKLLRGQTLDSMYADAATRAAYERFLEIISEASRHIPDEWKFTLAPGIKWRQVADLGNVLRHTYDKTDAGVLWSIYTDDLDSLERAIDLMIATHSHQP